MKSHANKKYADYQGYKMSVKNKGFSLQIKSKH